MKKYFLIMVWLLNYSFMSSASWLESLRHALGFSSTQESQQQQPALPQLSSREQLEMELRHLDTLQLEDQVVALEMELRHLQSLSFEHEIRELFEQRNAIDTRLSELTRFVDRERDIRSELSKSLKLLGTKREIEERLGNVIK